MPAFRRNRWSSSLLIGICFLFTSAGCGRSSDYEIAEVEGTLLLKGQPGKKVAIQFIPDIDKQTVGPTSTAETDESGHFVLQLMTGDAPAQAGAVVGWHRVVLTDLQLAESATGQGVPIRLAPEHSLPGTTPLVQQVKSGKQQITLEVQ